MNEQPPINFDNNENNESNHEVFTNLPNNTLNGVNPVGFDEPKTEVMENLVSDVQQEIKPALESETSAPTNEIVNTPVVEMPMVDDGAIDASNIAVETTMLNNETNVSTESTPVTLIETPIMESTPTVDTAINNEISVSTTPAVEVNENQAPVLNTNNGAKKVKLIVILSIVALVVGGISLYCFLILPKKDSTPKDQNSTNQTSGVTGVGVSDYKTVVLEEFKNTYVNGQNTNVNAQNTLKKLSDGTNDIFTVLTDGTISINSDVNVSIYDPVSFNNSKIIYFYGFASNDGYYILSTDGTLYKLEYTKTASGYVGIENIHISIVEQGVISIGAKKDGILYEIQTVGPDARVSLYKNITAIDTTVTNI